jgi:WD40 repeat protein
MKTTKTIMALIMLCSVLSGAAFEDMPLTQIRKHDVDPDSTAGACDGVEFSKYGAFYAAGDNHGVARIYRTSDGTYLGKATHDYEGGSCAKSSAEINGIAFSADGVFLATGDGGDDGAKIWDATLFNDTTPPSLTKALHHKVQGKETDGLDFSPNNKWLAVAADADVVIFNQQNNFDTL